MAGSGVCGAVSDWGFLEDMTPEDDEGVQRQCVWNGNAENEDYQGRQTAMKMGSLQPVARVARSNG